MSEVLVTFEAECQILMGKALLAAVATPTLNENICNVLVSVPSREKLYWCFLLAKLSAEEIGS